MGEHLPISRFLQLDSRNQFSSDTVASQSTRTNTLIKWKQSFMEWMLQIEMLEHSVNGDNTREDENTKYFCQVSGKTKLHHSLKIPRELALLWTRVAPAYANMIQKSLCSCTLHSRSFSGSKHAVPLPLSAKQPVNGGILSLIWLKHPVKRQTPITAVSLL